MQAVTPAELPAEVASLVAGYRQALEARFGARLRSLRLFGSRARGDAGPDSDVDVAVVISDLDENEREWVIRLAFEVWREAGYDQPRIEPLVWSEAEHRARLAAERRIALDVEREGRDA